MKPLQLSSLHEHRHTIERVVVVVLIVALAIVSFRSQHDQNVVSGEVTLLSGALDERTAELDALHTQVVDLQRNIERLQHELEYANDTVVYVQPPEPFVDDGAVRASWQVFGETLLPADLNADEIAVLEDEIEELEERADDNPDELATLRDEIRLLERERNALLEGEAKFSLTEVNVTIENERHEPVELSYVLCWPHIDCVVVRATGTIIAPAQQNSTHALQLDLPKMISLEKNRHVLRLVVSYNDERLIDGDYTIESP